MQNLRAHLEDLRAGVQIVLEEVDAILAQMTEPAPRTVADRVRAARSAPSNARPDKVDYPNHRQQWSEGDDQMLRRQYPEGDIDALVESLGRPIGSIHSRASKLGVARVAPSQRRSVKYPRTNKLWRADELEVLERQYGVMPVLRLASELQRTPGSIRSQVKHLRNSGDWRGAPLDKEMQRRAEIGARGVDR